MSGLSGTWPLVGATVEGDGQDAPVQRGRGVVGPDRPLWGSTPFVSGHRAIEGMGLGVPYPGEDHRECDGARREV
jgi:hypothetical protein